MFGMNALRELVRRQREDIEFLLDSLRNVRNGLVEFKADASDRLNQVRAEYRDRLDEHDKAIACLFARTDIKETAPPPKQKKPAPKKSKRK